MFTKKGILKISGLGAASYFIAYPYVKTDTKLFYQETEFNKKLIGRSDLYLKSYMPGFGISGKVRQVLYNIWFAKDITTHIAYDRTNLIMQDGGTISVDWALP